MTFAGADTYTLYGQNTYSGSTFILVRAFFARRIGKRVQSEFPGLDSAGAVLDLGGFNQVIAALGDERPPTGGEGKVTNNGAAPATLNIGPNGDSGNFSRTIGDGVSQLFPAQDRQRQTLSGSSTIPVQPRCSAAFWQAAPTMPSARTAPSSSDPTVFSP